MSHPIENIMHSSMEHIKALADVNTVIGDPMMTDDSTMILPVSKVSLGMLVGGGEYSACASSKKSGSDNCSSGEYPFIGASTVGMSLTPLAFLAVRSDGVRVLPAKQDCAAERLIDLMPKLMDTAERLLHELMGKGDSCNNSSHGRKSRMDMGDRATGPAANNARAADDVSSCEEEYSDGVCS